MSVTPLRDLLVKGIEAGASDWHIREGEPVSLRIRGEVMPQDFVATPGFMELVMSSVSDAKISLALEETGDADFAVVEKDVGRFRVNAHRQRGRLALTLRHVKATVPTADKLNLPPILLSISEATEGIVIVTGPTGTGKSTTLACMIEHINRTRRGHIITVEDPIEYSFEDNLCIVEQREVGLDTVSFDSALRHAMRQDPDVVVVGELRSRESFDTALTAAETGHLVMTTLHTSSAATSIGRILDFYPQGERDSVRSNLSSNLRAIICQRLLPRSDIEGQIPINEIMINTPVVSKLILEGSIKKLDSAIEAGVEEGMQNFNMSIFRLINNGSITEETGIKFASNPDALKMNLKGIFLSEAGGILSKNQSRREGVHSE